MNLYPVQVQNWFCTAELIYSYPYFQGHISKIRKVYDAFLAEFPLCYGYWKKYADHEERVGSTDKVIEVYEGQYKE